MSDRRIRSLVLSCWFLCVGFVHPRSNLGCDLLVVVIDHSLCLNKLNVSLFVKIRDTFDFLTLLVCVKVMVTLAFHLFIKMDSFHVL